MICQICDVMTSISTSDSAHLNNIFFEQQLTKSPDMANW